MYHWKAYLSSTWAGQSLSKYVLSRRAATNSTAAHVVPTGALSAAFGLTVHLISHVSVVTHSLTSRLRSHTKRAVDSEAWRRRLQQKKNRHELNSAMRDVSSKFWSILSVLPHAPTPEYWIYTSENVLYTQTERSPFWDSPLRVYNHIPW